MELVVVATAGGAAAVAFCIAVGAAVAVGVDAVAAGAAFGGGGAGGEMGGGAVRAAFVGAAVAASDGVLVGTGDTGLDTAGRAAAAGFERRASAAAVSATILDGAPFGPVATLVAILPATEAGCERDHHQPPAATIAIASRSHGNGLRRRRRAVNGVPRSGASPRRRCDSDFFRASSINDMWGFRGIGVCAIRAPARIIFTLLYYLHIVTAPAAPAKLRSKAFTPACAPDAGRPDRAPTARTAFPGRRSRRA